MVECLAGEWEKKVCVLCNTTNNPIERERSGFATRTLALDLSDSKNKNETVHSPTTPTRKERKVNRCFF